MSLHYMFYTFCSTWHVVIKLICLHLFAITWLRHNVAMWVHVHYHMVQLFACFYKMQGWISSHYLMNQCRACNLCAWNSWWTNKRKPLLHVGQVKVPSLGTFMQCANQRTINWRLCVNNAIVPLQHRKHCTMMPCLLRHHTQMTKKMVMMMVVVKKTKLHQLMEMSNLSFWQFYSWMLMCAQDNFMDSVISF